MTESSAPEGEMPTLPEPAHKPRDMSESGMPTLYGEPLAYGVIDSLEAARKAADAARREGLRGQFPAACVVFDMALSRLLAERSSAAQAAGGGAVSHPFTFCWLVELRPAFDSHPHFPATYYTGLMMAGSFEAEKTTDPLRAARFTRKEDAERIAERLGHTLSCVWTAIEHGFAAPDHPSPSREGPSDAEMLAFLLAHCKVVYYPTGSGYPVEHNPFALGYPKDGAFLLGALRAAMKEHQPWLT